MSVSVIQLVVVVSMLCVYVGALGPKISVSMMKDMVSVGSQEEFEAKYLNKAQYEQEQRERNQDVTQVTNTSRTHIGSGRPIGPDTRKGKVVTKNDPCSPRLLSVDIPSDDMRPGEVQYPMCTRLTRCGGCCAASMLVCRPTKIKRTIVATRRYSAAQNGLAGGKTKYFELDEHLACEQQCRVQAKDCTKKQKYVPDACMCECKVQKSCDTKIKYFDRSSCECVCKQKKKENCGRLAVWSYDKCECVAAKTHISQPIDVTKKPKTTSRDCSNKRCPPNFTPVVQDDGNCGCKPTG